MRHGLRPHSQAALRKDRQSALIGSFGGIRAACPVNRQRGASLLAAASLLTADFVHAGLKLDAVVPVVVALVIQRRWSIDLAAKSAGYRC